MVKQIKKIRQHFAPTGLQIAYCFIIACLIALYWCRDHILHVLIAGTQTSGTELHASFVQALGQVTNNNAFSFLSLALFWAMVGLVVAAALYESANVLISVRNDYLIATTYTRAGAYERSLLKVVFIKLLLAVGFIIFALLSWTIFFKAWHSLIVQPIPTFFHPHSIVNELVGLAGLTVNLYLGWMWLLFLLPQFFGNLA